MVCVQNRFKKNTICIVLLLFVLMLLFCFGEQRLDILCIEQQPRRNIEDFEWEMIGGPSGADMLCAKYGIQCKKNVDYKRYRVFVSIHPVKKFYYRRINNLWVWHKGDRILEYVFDYESNQDTLYFYLIPKEFYFQDYSKY